MEQIKTFLNIFKKKREESQRRLTILKSALKKMDEMRRDTETIEAELATIRVFRSASYSELLFTVYSLNWHVQLKIPQSWRKRLPRTPK